MSASAHQDLPPSPRVMVELTEKQELVIREAAELLGWSVAEYILCTVLDRAERDLYAHAAMRPHAVPHPTSHSAAGPLTESTVEAFTAVLGA